MATIPQEKKEEILFTLGVSPQDVSNYSVIDGEFFGITIARIDSLLAELAIIDEKLISARDDSMAVVIDSLQVSYTQHVNHLNISGNKLLRELSNIADIPILYNKYLGNSNTRSMVSY